MNSDVHILGLDLSLAHTGYSLHRPDGTQCRGLIEPGKRMGMERLEFIRGQVWQLLSPFERSGEPLLVLIEGYSFASRGMSIYQLAELGGLIRFLLYRKEVLYLEIPPLQLKKFVTGKAMGVKKELMLKELYKQFGDDVDDNNICDAAGLAYIGEALVGRSKMRNQHQRDVVERIRKAHSSCQLIQL